MWLPGDSGTGKLNNQPASAKFCGDTCSFLDRSSILSWISIRSRSMVLMTKTGKNLQPKNKFVGSKSAIYLSLGLHKGRLSYRRSLQPSKENIQHFRTWNFLICSIFVGHLALLDPDSGSTNLIEFGSRIHGCRYTYLLKRCFVLFYSRASGARYRRSGWTGRFPSSPPPSPSAWA